MENKIWQWLVKIWSALTGKISLAVQIASVLSLTLVSVLVVLLVANRLGVEDSFLRLLGIEDSFLLLLGILLFLLLFSALIIWLVLYPRQHNKASIGDFFRRIIDRTTELRCGPFRLKMVPDLDFSQRKPEAHIKSDKVISDPVSPRSKLDNNSGASLSDTATSSGSSDINKLKGRAEQGDARAQASLGTLYYKGLEVEQDRVKAAKWYRLAAEQGNANAQFNLGLLYYSGEGVEQDYAEAAKYFRLAAEQKIAKAQFGLGVLYYKGEEVKQDYAEAAEWYRLAAEQGLAEAQFNLGVLYYKGEEVKQDYAEAAEWYRLAAEQGHAKAQFNLGVSYHNGEGVAQNYSEAYIWFSLASASNDPDARKARNKVARKLDSGAMKNAQAEATRREEKIRRKREGESQ